LIDTSRQSTSQMSGRRSPLVIWRVSDGRAGHDSQSLGLVRALSAISASTVYEIPAPPARVTIIGLLLRNCLPASALPDPDLIIGAGHGTHLALLCAQRARGGRTIVLMKPSLPRTWFDLCLIPEHDGIPADGHTIITRGPLNKIIGAGNKDRGKGLILVGGTSRHYHWDEQALASRILSICGPTAVRWTMTDSPRTPASTKKVLATLNKPNLRYLPCAETGPEWLPAELSLSATVWVTEDSISMIYESLTAGAAVGILPLRARHNNRLAASIHRLVANGTVTSFNDWKSGRQPEPPKTVFNEAERCARLILEYLALPVQ